MKKEPELTFATILHLSEMYCDQYNEGGLCLSPEANEWYFRDFVNQYRSALCWGQKPNPVINIDMPAF